MILVVAAHPDDELLGAGGMILRAVAQKEPIAVLIVAEGVTSRDDGTREQAIELETTSRRILNECGVLDVTYLRRSDQLLDVEPLLTLVKAIEPTIARLAPDTVFTHHTGCLNLDHGLVARAVITATRPTPSCPVKNLLSFEIPSSTEWAFGQLGEFRPRHFIDIAPYLDRKIKALAGYGDEFRSFPHARSERGIRAQAERWGATCGRKAVEAFEAVRVIV